MKSGIHPTYFPNAVITCACGNSITTGSTQETIKVELCSHCHPFYTGKQHLVDTAGRVERFKVRLTKKSETLTKKKTEEKKKKEIKTLTDQVKAVQAKIDAK